MDDFLTRERYYFTPLNHAKAMAILNLARSM